MKTDIILAGVGGQGILSIAAVIGTAAIQSNIYVKQAEVHGMSQRGGAVQSHLRLAHEPIYSDLIPHGECDLILSVEPMESLRYLPFLSKEGWVITNSKTFENIPNYPENEKLFQRIKAIGNHRLVDADTIATELGTRKASNIVMLGAAADRIGIDFSQLEDAIRAIFSKKGEEIVQLNLDALKAGKAAI